MRGLCCGKLLKKEKNCIIEWVCKYLPAVIRLGRPKDRSIKVITLKETTVSSIKLVLWRCSRKWENLYVAEVNDSILSWMQFEVSEMSSLGWMSLSPTQLDYLFENKDALRVFLDPWSRGCHWGLPCFWRKRKSYSGPS